MSTTEETLDTFLATCAKASPDVLARAHPHPFLYREVVVGDGTRKFTEAEIAQKTRRFERLMGQHGGYVLMQQGHRQIETLLKEAATTGETVLEPRIVRVSGRPGAGVRVGSSEDADVVLPLKTDAVLSIGLAADGVDFEIALEEGEAWYDGERLSPSRRVLLEDGLRLQIGASVGYQTFTPGGFFRFLLFRERLGQARSLGGG